MGREIGVFRIPQAAEEVIKGTDTWSVTYLETGQYSMKVVFF